MIPIYGWLTRKAGAETVATLVILLGALGTLTLALQSILRGFDLWLVLTVAIFGLLVGWALAKSPLPGWLAGCIALIVGIEIILGRVGQLGGKLIAAAQALTRLASQILNLPRGTWPDLTPVLYALQEFWNDIATLLIRFFDWAKAILDGQPAFDPVANALLWSLLLWLIAVWIGWAVRRHEQPFEALLPAIVLSAAMLGYTGGNAAFLIPLLAVTLLLMALVGTQARERRWARDGIDIAQDIRTDVVFVAVPLTALLIVAATLTPTISIREIARLAQETLEQRAGEASGLPDSFGLILPPVQRSAFDPVRTPGLPRYHLIGAGPELSKQIAMLIRTDDGRPYYWRASTYDDYNGRGWSTSTADIVNYKAGEKAIQKIGPGYRRVIQDAQIVGELGGLLYSTGVLATTDHDYRVAWRSAEDAFSASIQATGYRAESWTPVVSEAQLRSAGNNYPEWVRDRYLYLRDDVPPRVLALGRDLTAAQRTPYDRARALVDYLRTFPYTLDLPAPPFNRDVVDYFLFDLKKGYCDYFASAMVVLARGAGLPARLVVGYAPGSYDPENARYVVTEMDAHSWAEIYFPDYGWIEFEPTSSRAPITVPEESSQSEDYKPRTEPTPGLAEELQASRNRWQPFLFGSLALVVLAGLVWSVIDNCRLRLVSPKRTISAIYSRVIRFARRLDVSARAADTPNEIAGRFSARIVSLAQNRRARAWLNSAEPELRWLNALYIRSCYSPHGLGVADQQQAIQVWRRLHRRLWIAWIWHKLRPARERG